MHFLHTTLHIHKIDIDEILVILAHRSLILISRSFNRNIK